MAVFEDRGQCLFIVIEGIDGTGKSTVAQLLAKKLDGICVKTPFDEFIPLKKFFNKLNNSTAKFFSFYLLS